MIHAIHCGEQAGYTVCGSQWHGACLLQRFATRGHINNCEGCHNTPDAGDAASYYPVDPTRVLATTVDAGADRGSAIDDVAWSPNTAVCSACHTDSLAETHMLQNGGSKNLSKNADGTTAGGPTRNLPAVSRSRPYRRREGASRSRSLRVPGAGGGRAVTSRARPIALVGACIALAAVASLAAQETPPPTEPQTTAPPAAPDAAPPAPAATEAPAAPDAAPRDACGGAIQPQGCRYVPRLSRRCEDAGHFQNAACPPHRCTNAVRSRPVAVRGLPRPGRRPRRPSTIRSAAPAHTDLRQRITRAGRSAEQYVSRLSRRGRT